METKDIKYDYQEYRNKLEKVIEISEADYEKKVLYIASGALVLSLTVFTDIIKLGDCLYLGCMYSSGLQIPTNNKNTDFLTRCLCLCLCLTYT